jgi:hypothetical protein
MPISKSPKTSIMPASAPTIFHSGLIAFQRLRVLAVLVLQLREKAVLDCGLFSSFTNAS